MDRSTIDTELFSALADFTYCMALRVFDMGIDEQLNNAKRLAFCQCAGILANLLLAKIYAFRSECEESEWIE